MLAITNTYPNDPPITSVKPLFCYRLAHYYHRDMSTPTSKGIALVTGAAQGIGRAIALRLAEDFDVAVNDLPANSQALDSLCAEIIAKGRRAYPVLADVSVENEVKIMIDTVVTELGGLDVVRIATPIHPTSILYTDLHRQMVANAGIYKEASILECQLQHFPFIRIRVVLTDEILSLKALLKILTVSAPSTFGEPSSVISMLV
jgi:short-subunit dehydrogenase involved in D-alanine esterification of teichoic acids